MKKTVLALTLAMVFGLTACAGGGGGGSFAPKQQINNPPASSGTGAGKQENSARGATSSQGGSASPSQGGSTGVGAGGSHAGTPSPELVGDNNSHSGGGSRGGNSAGENSLEVTPPPAARTGLPSREEESEEEKRRKQEDEKRKQEEREELLKDVKNVNNIAENFKKQHSEPEYIFGYGISDNERNNTLKPVTYSDGQFTVNKNGSPVNLPVTTENLLYGYNENIDTEMKSKIDSGGNFVVDYGGHTFLGRSGTTTFAFGFRTTKEQMETLNEHLNGYDYRGKALVWVKGDDTNSIKVGSFTGRISSNGHKVSGSITVGSEFTMTLQSTNLDGSGSFTGSVTTSGRFSSESLKYQGQLNGDQAEGMSGVVTGSDKVGAAFAGKTGN